MTAGARLDALFETFDRRAPGCVVAVAHKNSVIYRAAFGLADLDRKIPLTPTTPIPIGSVTKQMTAALALTLAQDGRLDMDLGIDAYVGGLPKVAGVASLRQLAGHMGGYRCYLDATFADGFGMRADGATLAFMRRQADCEFAPGSAQIYNNTGYYLLSLAIEAASGTSFEEALREGLLAPLGMENSASVRHDAAAPPGLARAYVPTPDGAFLPGVNISQERLGDGAVVSTVDDLLRWLRELRSPQPQRARIFDALARPYILPDGAASSYGMGVRVGDYRGLRFIGHGGNVMGASAYALTLPEQDLDVAVVFNHAANAEAWAWRTVDAVLGVSGDDSHEATLPLAEGAMFYNADSGRLYRIGRAAAPAALRFQDGPLMPLQQTAAGECVLPTPTGFHRYSVADDALLAIEGGVPRRYTRLAPCEGDASGALGDAEGGYWSDDAAAHGDLVSSSGAIRFLCRGLHGENQFDLSPVARDLFSVRHALMPFAAVLRLVRAQGRVVGFEITTARTRRLTFRKTGASA